MAGRFQRARTFWGTLSDEQFLTWEAAGRERRTQSVLGRSSALPGYLVSVSCVDHYPFLGVLPEEDGELVDITDLYVARHGVPPAGKRIFIQTVQQINGWQDRPNTLRNRVPAP